MLGESLLIGGAEQGGGGGTIITNSLRFDSARTTYLQRTFGTPTTQDVFTFSTWIKRNGSTTGYLFGNSATATTAAYFGFPNISGQAYNLTLVYASASRGVSDGFYVDQSAWAHVLWQNDGGRHQFFYNGVVVAQFLYTLPVINVAGTTHTIGRGSTNLYSNDYMADIHFVDGQALGPESFVEFDSNGIVQPIPYAGTYGNNGFYLTFSDDSSATETGIGKDSSGNGNNWTPTNMEVTGENRDVMVDSPTNGQAIQATDPGGVVIGNYCTLQRANAGSYILPTISNGNLYISSAPSGRGAAGTMGVSSGKYYWEVTVLNGSGSENRIGVMNSKELVTVGSVASSPTGVLYGVRLDATAGVIEYSADGVNWTVISSSLTFPPYRPFYYSSGNTTTKRITFNFGQQPFGLTPPAGYVSLNTTNLPADVVKPKTVFEGVKYTGTGSPQSPTQSLKFSPGLILLKNTSGQSDPVYGDAVRGVQRSVSTVGTTAGEGRTETQDDNGILSFDGGGFTVGTSQDWNKSGVDYNAWCWAVPSTSVPNNNGTIPTQVAANQAAGFSVMTFTGNGGFTIGHGLNVPPELTIWKNLDSTGLFYFDVAVKDFGHVYWSTGYFRGNAITSTRAVPDTQVVSLAGTPTNGQRYVAYSFAPTPGVSAMGRYTGDAASQSDFQYTGFKPKLLLIKGADDSKGLTYWDHFDESLDSYNGSTRLFSLYANVAPSGGADNVRLFANGFQASYNSGSNLFYWFAFADTPFKIGRAR